jgi:hypothetical protein
LYKTAPLKNARGDFGYVEIYKKVEYIWTSEYAVFNRMTSESLRWIHLEMTEKSKKSLKSSNFCMGA